MENYVVKCDEELQEILFKEILDLGATVKVHNIKLGYMVESLSSVVQNSFSRMHDDLSEKDYARLIKLYTKEFDRSYNKVIDELDSPETELGLLDNHKTKNKLSEINEKIKILLNEVVLK